MPKRARCPHCDRLFNRDQLDNHIRRCRRRRTGDLRSNRPGRRKAVVVDGNNIAYYLSSDGIPRASNLIIAHRSLTGAGLNPIFVVSAALKHKIDKPIALRELIGEKRIKEAPSGKDDDLIIIKTAQELNADIVSNDRFLKYLDRFPWLPERLLKYRMTPAGLILS
jgi:hypothetical protein